MKLNRILILSISLFSILISSLVLTSCGYYNATVSGGINNESTSPAASVNTETPGVFSITATTAGDQQVTLTWSNSSSATHYIVKHGSSSDSYTTTDSSNTSSPYTVTGLTNGTSYYFMVQAVNANNTTTTNTRNATAEASATPIALPSSPALTLDISNSTHWDLSWSTSTGTAPITYTVSRTTTYGSGYVDIPICISLGTTSCSDSTIAVDSTYCYKVTASNTGGSTTSTEVCPPLSTPPTLTLTSYTNIQIPTVGGAPPLFYSIDSGTGTIDPHTGIFKSTISGPTSIKVTDSKNNFQTISVNNIKIRVNGSVSAMVQAGTSLYVGGNFTNVNTISAPKMISLNTTTGKPNYNCDLQSGFNGSVFALYPTTNAIFVGGNFTQFKGQSANYIAKLNLPNCDLDTTFSPPASNGFNSSVRSIILSGTSLFVGGEFTAYKGIANSANYIAKLDLNTGAIDTTFSPPGTTSNGFDNSVRSFALSGSNLYVGGYFTAYKGIANSANRLAKLDLTTGAIDTTFSPPGATSNGFGGAVRALAVSGSNLYVGGHFTAYKGIANSANYLAKLDLTTGAIDTIFSPVGATSNGFDYNVHALAISGSNLYVGGAFYAYKGIADSANYLAKLDLTTGAIDTTFSPVGANSNGFDYYVKALAVSGSSLYVCGDYFKSYRGIANSAISLAKLDLTTGAIDTTFSPPSSNGLNDEAYAIAVSNSNLFVGGAFKSYNQNSFSANHLAKFDLTTGEFDTTFSPPANNGFDYTVNALTVSGSSLYVGGSFTAYKGIANSANKLAKLDLTTGAIDTAFSPAGATSNGFENTVNALTVSGTSLYVGGSFTAYKGIANSANKLAKLDLTTGAIDTTFSPVGASSNGFNTFTGVEALAVSGSSLYVGGSFTAYKGIANSANYLAKLDLTTGAIDTTFSPPGATSNGFGGAVRALAISGSSLYVGGGFTAYKGIANSANSLAKLDLTTGAIDTTFSPVGASNNGFESIVYTLLVSGSSLYVGGRFTAYKGIANSANSLAKLDLTTGAIDTTFSPVGASNNGFNSFSNVSALVISGSNLYVGGWFTTYRGTQHALNLVPLDPVSGALLDP